MKQAPLRGFLCLPRDRIGSCPGTERSDTGRSDTDMWPPVVNRGPALCAAIGLPARPRVRLHLGPMALARCELPVGQRLPTPAGGQDGARGTAAPRLQGWAMTDANRDHGPHADDAGS